MIDIREGFPSNYRRKPTMAICEADGKEYWVYSGIHNEISKPYKNNKKKENLSNVVLKTDGKDKQFRTLVLPLTGKGWDRDVDAEAKLFEFLATRNVKEVLLVVDLDMCDSCKGVLKRFIAKYPDIDVRIAKKNLKNEKGGIRYEFI